MGSTTSTSTSTNKRTESVDADESQLHSLPYADAFKQEVINNYCTLAVIQNSGHQKIEFNGQNFYGILI